MYFRKEQINRNNTASVEQTARLKDRKIVHWTVNKRTWKNTVLSFVEPTDSRDFPLRFPQNVVLARRIECDMIFDILIFYYLCTVKSSAKITNNAKI